MTTTARTVVDSSVLTQMEFNVAYLRSQGKLAKQISYTSRISRRTVHDILAMVFKKIGVNDPVGLRIFFEQEGI